MGCLRYLYFFGKAQQASQPSQGRALQARWQSQARQHSLQEQQHSRLRRLCGGFAAAVVVLAESVAWLGSATSPGVLCLGSAGSLAVPCLGSVCLVLTCCLCAGRAGGGGRSSLSRSVFVLDPTPPPLPHPPSPNPSPTLPQIHFWDFLSSFLSSLASSSSEIRKSKKSRMVFESNQGSGAFRSASIGIVSKS